MKVELEELAVVIERALQHRALRTENRELKKFVDGRDGFAGIVGQSPAMRGANTGDGALARTPSATGSNSTRIKGPTRSTPPQ